MSAEPIALPDGTPLPLADFGAVSKARMERSLRYFIRCAWHVVEPGRPFVDNWHIGAIVEHLMGVSDGEIKRLLINMPPRHMKSLSVGVFWPAWIWIARPETRFFTASYEGGLSMRDNVQMRDLIASPWYRHRWPHVTLKRDNNAQSNFKNTRNGRRMSTSVRGATTGWGGDINIIDDPHNVRQTESDAVRQEALQWHDTAWSTRITGPDTAFVYVMQRIHEQDLAGHLLAKGYDDLVHLILPARWEGAPYVSGWRPPERDASGERRRDEEGAVVYRKAPIPDPRTAEGELLWPQWLTEKAVSDMERDLGPTGAAGQLQQRPAPAGGTILKHEAWRYYAQLPDSYDDYISSWDMAFKGRTGARSVGAGPSYVVGQVWLRKGADFYLIEQVRDQWDFVASQTQVAALASRYPQCRAHLIEDKANGPAILSSLAEHVPALLPIEPLGDKIARAYAVQPLLEAGNVYLPAPLLWPGVADFVQRCGLFPNGRWSDEVDALTQALTWLKTNAALMAGVRLSHGSGVTGWSPAAPSGR